jgi:hypothetical protein
LKKSSDSFLGFSYLTSNGIISGESILSENITDVVFSKAFLHIHQLFKFLPILRSVYVESTPGGLNRLLAICAYENDRVGTRHWLRKVGRRDHVVRIAGSWNWEARLGM